MIGRRPLLSALGLAIVAPSARAQPGRTHRLALLDASFALEDLQEGGNARYEAFFSELRRLGHAEGSGLEVKRLAGRGLPEADWTGLAQEALAWGPDIVFATPSRMALQVKALTTTVPVVFIGGAPVGGGLVASLARPGGNVTGFASDAGSETYHKQMQLVLEVVPDAQRIALLGRREWWAGPFGEGYLDGARLLSVDLTLALVEGAVDESSLTRAFQTLRDNPPPVMVIGAISEFIPHAAVIAQLALEARLPAITGQNLLAEAGVLMSYGVNFPDLFRRAAGYIDEILGGTDPAAMPVQQAILFDFIVNLKTAAALGLVLPPSILTFANGFIE